jgi:hypothetical protein
VAGDEVAVREHLHVTGTEPDADLPSGEACRHRVPALAHADPGLGVDSRRQGHAGHERLDRKRSERRPLGGKGLLDRLGAPGDPAAVVAPVRRHEVSVGSRHVGDLGDRDEVASAEAAHLALDATLLVGPRLPRDAEERVEAIVAVERDEAVGLGPVAPDQHLLYGTREVVVPDPPGDSPEARERDRVALEEGCLVGRQEGERDGLAGRRQPQVKEMHLRRLAGADDRRLAEVDLASSPAPWQATIITDARPPPVPSSARSSRTYSRTVDSATVAPCSSSRRSQIRRAVWRCLRGTARSSISQLRISGFQAPSVGAALGVLARVGGRANANAWRTVRRWTPWRRDRFARIALPPACHAEYARRAPPSTTPSPDTLRTVRQ